MGDNQRIIRQWIETDAAFGAVEFPIPRRRRAARAASAPPAKGISPGLAPASYQPRPSAMELPAPRPAAPRPAVPPAFAPGQPSGEPPVAKARKITVEMPAAPTGNIAELPQVTREEKLARLATLQAFGKQEIGGRGRRRPATA